MPAVKEVDTNLVPEGFIGAKQAAHVLGCSEKFLSSRRWVRRMGLPALQLRRGWPIFFDEKQLREWVSRRKRTVKGEERHDGPKRARRKNGRAAANT